MRDRLPAEAIAVPPHSFNPFGTHRSDFLPYILDVGIDAAVVGFETVIKTVFENLRSRNQNTRICNQIAHDSPLHRGQTDRFPIKAEDVALLIKPEAGRTERPIRRAILLGRAQLNPGEQRLYPQREFLGGKRLAHIVVRTELKAEDPVAFRASAGNEDHRQRVALLHLL